MFFCPIHDQLRTLVDHDKQSKEKAVKNTRSNCGAHTPPRWCALSFVKQPKRTCPPLSPEPSTDQVLWERRYPRQRPYAFGCLPSFSETKFTHDLLHISLRDLRRCQLDFPSVLISCSTFRRRWCCIHNRPVSRLWILFQSKSWRNALRCAAVFFAILDTRSSPRSRATDFMVIPTLAFLTMPRYSASTENRTGADCEQFGIGCDTLHKVQFLIGFVTRPIRICESVEQTRRFPTTVLLNPSSVCLQILRNSLQSTPLSYRGLVHSSCQSIWTELYMWKICTKIGESRNA